MCLKVRVNHPFHPMAGNEFELVRRRWHWGEDRVVYACPEGTLRNQKFFSLTECNAAVSAAMAAMNERVMRRLG